MGGRGGTAGAGNDPHPGRLGLRISELTGLRVTDVDFLRREVRITGQLDPRGRRAPLKTGNSMRVIPLPARVAEVLSEHLRRFPPGPAGLVFTRERERCGNGRLITQARRADRSWGRAYAAVAYRQAGTAAGLPDGTTSHDLRHHYASVLLDAGESVHAVAERLREHR